MRLSAFCFEIDCGNKTLQGFNILLPLLDRIKYVQVMKELAIEVPQQGAVTSDNVQLQIDGVLYLRVVDPYKVYKLFFPHFYFFLFLRIIKRILFHVSDVTYLDDSNVGIFNFSP